MPEPRSREELIYHERIETLLDQIEVAAKDAGIPFLMVFQIQIGKAETINYRSNFPEDTDPRLIDAWRQIR